MQYHRIQKFLVEDEGEKMVLSYMQGEKEIMLGEIKGGPDRDLNPGPLAPEARIIPLDHQANWCRLCRKLSINTVP